MTTPDTSLSIKQLNLFVSLGWPEKERLEKQSILMDIDIDFNTAPSACVSDQLQDTLCYSDLIESLRNTLENQTFHLIEHLCHAAFHLLKPSLPSDARLHISVLKHPAILGLAGGVAFSMKEPAS